MKYLECEQGTPEWLKARAGAITASKFQLACEGYYKPTKTDPDPWRPKAEQLLYEAQVAIERISGEPIDEGFQSWQMKRGQEEEPRGREEYIIRSGNFVERGGICFTDDRLFGYSTDGFVDDDGLIEIKSLVSAATIVNLWLTNDLSEWIHQMQGGLWITGRKWCDFIAWCPQLASVGRDLYVRRVHRDEAFIEDMEQRLWRFGQRVLAREKALRAPVPELALA